MSAMEGNKDIPPVVSPVASPQTDTIEPAPHASSATPAPETTAPDTIAPASTATPPADDQAPADSEPPRYERYEDHGKEVVLPASAVMTTNPTSPPTEKTAWQSATSAPAVPQGQGLVAQRAIEINQLGEEPRLVNCPFCHRETMTRVQKESTSATGMAAVCCCLFGGICCAFLPFCMEMCHDAHHFCAKCGQKVAIRPHDGPVQVFSPAPPVVIAPGHIQPPQAVAVSHGTSGISEKN